MRSGGKMGGGNPRRVHGTTPVRGEAKGLGDALARCEELPSKEKRSACAENVRACGDQYERGNPFRVAIPGRGPDGGERFVHAKTLAECLRQAFQVPRLFGPRREIRAEEPAAPPDERGWDDAGVEEAPVERPAPRRRPVPDEGAAAAAARRRAERDRVAIRFLDAGFRPQMGADRRFETTLSYFMDGDVRGGIKIEMTYSIERVSRGRYRMEYAIEADGEAASRGEIEFSVTDGRISDDLAFGITLDGDYRTVKSVKIVRR